MELGKLTAVFDADTKRFDAGLHHVQSKIGGVTKDLSKATAGTNQLANSLAPATSRLTGMSAAMGVAAGATVLVAGAVGGAAAGILKLAEFSQELGGEIFDLSTKINFTAETLSSLKVAAELSGGSLASLSTALGIFDRNIEEAKEGGSEMSRVFKALKIDTDDNEQALRQAFTTLGKLSEGSQQTALAMKLFGRSGKEVLGVIKETGGNLDAFIDRMRELGLVITSDGAKKADQFGDQLTLLRNKLEAVGRQIGQELVPIVSKAADDISGWLKDNQAEILQTAKDVASLVSEFYKLAKFIAENSPVTFIVRVVRQFLDSDVMSPGAMLDKQALSAIKARSSANAPAQLPGGLPTLSVFQKRSGGPTNFSPFAAPGGAAVPALDFGKPGGGGGGGGGGAKAQKDVLESLKKEVMGLNTEFRKLDVELLNSANLTALAAEKEKILSTVMGQLSDENQTAVSKIKDVDQALDAAIGKLPAKSQAAAKALRDQALAQFQVNEKTRIAGELMKATEDLTKQWKQETDNARTGADEHAIAIQNLDAEYRKYGLTLDEGQKRELQAAAAEKKHWEMLWELIGNANTRIQAHIDLLGSLEDQREAATKAMTGAGTVFGDFEELLKIEPPDLSEQSQAILKIREQMRDLGRDLTDIFAESIHTGFDRGVKAGLATLAQGLLQIVENIFLRRLEAGLSEALGGLATGGGILGTILRGGRSLPGSAPGAARNQTVTPRDVTAQTHEINQATEHQTQALSNQIQLTGQQIVQGLRPPTQSFGAGLLNAVLQGALGGLAGGITSGRGRGGGGPEGGVASTYQGTGMSSGRPQIVPFVPHRAGGGRVSGGSPYMVGENGPELFVPSLAGNIYNKEQQGGTTVINIALPPMPPGSYKSPASQRQLANQVLSALQGAKR